MSNHSVYVVPVVLNKHDNADKLSVVKINDYTCVVNTEDFSNIEKGVWIPPDSIVDISREEFKFLKKGKIRAQKIRGVVSYGLLIPAPELFAIGQDVTEYYGIKHYDPDIQSVKKDKNVYFNQSVPDPPGTYFKYDLENFQNYARQIFSDKEIVYVSEKLHGESARYVFVDKQFCGSRGEWKSEYATAKLSLEKFLEKQEDKERGERIYESTLKERNKWWDIYTKTPQIKHFCTDNPGYCLYGEIYGMQKNFAYNASPQNIKFACFDILKPDGKWMDYEDWLKMVIKYTLPCVPYMGVHEFNVEKLIEMAEGITYMGNTHMREGIVIKPLVERWHEKLGRVCLKLVSHSYLEKN